MSQENMEIVRRIFDAYADGGIEAALPFFTPDVVMHPFPEWIEESEYRGHEGVRRLIAVWTENFDEFEFHVHQIRQVGDQVLALAETAGRIKAQAFRSDSPSGSSTPIFVTA